MKFSALSAIIIIASISNAEAKPSFGNEFCGDRYCGYRDGRSYKSHHVKRVKKHRGEPRAIAHAVKSVEPSIPLPKPKSLTSDGLAAQAAKYLGMQAPQVGVRSTLWCSAFIRKLTNTKGVDDRAFSWLRRPKIAPQVNAIAIFKHSHVGIVAGFTKNGDVIVISGNYGHKVARSVYSKSKIMAYVSA